MKQYTTPTIPIQIPIDLNKISRVEFIFKKLVDTCTNKDRYKSYPVLVHRIFNVDEIKTTETEEIDGFEMLLSLTAEETLKLPCGQVLMDTLIILTDGSIPETELTIFEISPTLFEGVDSDGKP